MRMNYWHIFICSILLFTVSPAKGKTAELQEQDGPEIKHNIELYSRLIKAGEFENAYEPWLYVFTHSPLATPDVCTDGTKILHALIAAEQDSAEHQKLFEQLTAIYDRQAELLDSLNVISKKPVTLQEIRGRKAHEYVVFAGDQMDQRSWTNFMTDWLNEAYRLCRPGAPICLFIDWRQLPSMTDALQRSGWIWRGIAVWDKATCRPQKGRFRQQAEFIVWGSKEAMPLQRNVGCLPGVFRHTNPANRIHVTEKSLPLMRDIVQICEPGGRILDPFAGAGTTILAAVREGYEAVGIEKTAAYYKLGSDRVKFALEAGEIAK